MYYNGFTFLLCFIIKLVIVGYLAFCDSDQLMKETLNRKLIFELELICVIKFLETVQFSLKAIAVCGRHRDLFFLGGGGPCST